MGSKSPDGRENGHHGNPIESVQSNRVGGEPRGSHTSRDGDGCLGDGGDEDGDGDGDGGRGGGEVSLHSPEAQPPTDNSDVEATTKKSKKKKKKSKKKRNTAKSPIEQTSPPRIPLSDLYPANDYAEGEQQDYSSPVDARTRNSSSAEARYNARLLERDDDFLANYRKAAEVHRQARQWVQETVQPGHTLASIADSIEDTVRALLGNAGLETGDCLKSGMGFPTGICLNHEVAHYTPNPGQKDVLLQQQDVMTIDFGVHINGWIVDSAFTMAFDPVYDNLLAAVKDATNTGIKNAGIDVRISDVSAAIQEAMESYEVEIRGRTYPVKAIRNLSGHNITRYHIHGGKSIPFVKNSDQTKMEAGEVFAIETFGSTGRGWIHDDVGVYGYGLEQDAPLTTPISLSSARRLHKTIRENFGTLPFSRRYLERLGVEKYLAGMSALVSNGIVEQYRPLTEAKGSYAAQFEHTLILHDTHKEVLSRGNDY